GPSAAIVISELADLGAKVMIRVGTCGALDGSLELGELLIAVAAVAADGTSQALGAGGRTRASPELTAKLQSTNRARTGVVASTHLFYDDRKGQELQWTAAGAVAVEMETATLFAVAAKRELEAASVLIVSDLLHPRRVR